MTDTNLQENGSKRPTQFVLVLILFRQRIGIEVL